MSLVSFIEQRFKDLHNNVNPPQARPAPQPAQFSPVAQQRIMARNPTAGMQQIAHGPVMPNMAVAPHPVVQPNLVHQNLQALGLAAARTGIGLGQAGSGLVDLASKGTGTSRVSNWLNQQATHVDQQAKKDGVNAGYKTYQVPLNVATFLTPGAAVEGLKGAEAATKAAETANSASHAIPLVAKGIDKLAARGAAGRITAAGLKTGLAPSNFLNAGVATGLQVGTNASKGGRTTPLGTAGTFGTNLAFGGVLGAGGQVLKETPGAVVNGAKALDGRMNTAKDFQGKNDAITSQQKQLRSEIKQHQQDIKDLPIGTNRSQIATNTLLQKIDSKQNMIDRLEANRPQRNIAQKTVDKALTLQPGLSMKAVDENGNPVSGLSGKPVAATADTVATTTPKPQLPGAAESTGKAAGKPASAAGSGASANGTAESRFPLRVMEDPRTDPILPTLNKLATHDIKHNAPVLEATGNKIAQNEDAALAFAKRGSSTEANATAMQLLEKYLSEGSHEKASELLQSIAPRFTRQGQETQILAAYSKTATPAGAVRYATKEVEKAAGKSVNGLKLEDKTAQVHTAVKQTAKDVANQLSEEVRTGKVGKPSATKAVKTSKTPEEMLANRIKAPSDRKFTAQDPVKDMVATLHKVAKQVIPDAEKKLPRDPMELVGQAIKGKAEYAGVYDKAKALVLDKYKDNPAALAELEKYFGTDATRTYAQSQLNTGMQQALKGTNLSKIVKEHYSKVDETGQELKQKLIERAGLSESEATQLSGDIQKRYDQLIATKKESVIKQIFGDKPKPEQVQLADRILQYHNLGAMSRDELRPLVAKKLGLETLSPEASKTISDMAAHIQTLTDGSPERLQATADMMRFIAEQKPQSALDNAVGIYKAGLLSGVKTQQGNALSNSIFGGLKKVSDIPASVADRGFALAGKTPLGKHVGLTGDRTIGLTGRGAISGANTGISKGVSIMKGRPEYTVGDKYEQHAEINLNNRVLQRVFGTPSNYVFRGMQAADQPFRYAALKNSLYDQAYAAGRNEGLSGGALKARAEQLVNNPTEQMATTATREAKKSVLDYDTYASRAIQAAHTGIDRMVENGGSPLGGKIANGALNILAPFVRVPSAFISRTVDFTLLGIGKEIGHQLFTKTFDQRALSQAIGEGLTGTGIIALGMHLSGQGQLSGDYPKNDQKEQQRWKAEGIQPNSIKIGKSWKSLNYLGPIGMLFSVGKNIDEAKGSSNIEKTSQAIAGLGRGLLGQSFLQGLNGFSTAVQDPTKVGSYLNSEASSIIPAWVNDIGNATDKLQRQADNVGEAVKGRLPGIRHGLNPKQDVYGNNLPNQASGLNAINGLKPSNDLTTNNPVTSEVSRLHNVNPDDSNLQVTPTPVGKSISVEGTNVPLNPKQQYALQKQTGQLLQSKWNDLIKTPEYQAMDDTQKAAALGNIKSQANEIATRTYVTQNNLGTYSKPMSKKAVALQQGTSDIATLASSKKTGASTSTSDYYKSPDAEYKALQTKYNQTKFNSPAERIRATNELNRAKVGSSFTKSTRDLYGLSKNDVYKLVTTDPNGKQIANDLLKYGDALQQAGIENNKFRVLRTGSESFKPKTTVGRSGSTKFKTASIPGIRNNPYKTASSRQKFKISTMPKLATSKHASYKTTAIAANLNRKLRTA